MDDYVNHARNTNFFLLGLTLALILAALNFPSTVKEAERLDNLRKDAELLSCLVVSRNGLETSYKQFKEDPTRLQNVFGNATIFEGLADSVECNQAAMTVVRKLRKIQRTMETPSAGDSGSQLVVDLFKQLVAPETHSFDSLGSDWIKLIWTAGLLRDHLRIDSTSEHQIDSSLTCCDVLFTCKLLGLSDNLFDEFLDSWHDIDGSNITFTGKVTAKSLDAYIARLQAELESKAYLDKIPGNTGGQMQLPALGLATSVLYFVPIYIVLSVCVLIYMVGLLGHVLQNLDSADISNCNFNWLPIIACRNKSRLVKCLAFLFVWLPLVALVGSEVLLVIFPLTDIPQLSWLAYHISIHIGWLVLAVAWALIGFLSTRHVWKSSREICDKISIPAATSSPPTPPGGDPPTDPSSGAPGSPAPSPAPPPTEIDSGEGEADVTSQSGDD